MALHGLLQAIIILYNTDRLADRITTLQTYAMHGRQSRFTDDYVMFVPNAN